MPRNAAQNEQVRKARKQQILDAALTVYLRYGFHGTDMDAVAAQAHLAKGLLYYYFKTKRELFIALYDWMLEEAFSLSASLLRSGAGRSPVEQLMAYTYALFAESRENRRLMQFCIRIPFDAYAIFGPDEWKNGVQKSDIHRQALTEIIRQGMRQGSIPPTDPSAAANSFWSVFVGNAFAYTRMIAGKESPSENTERDFEQIVQFCFQGLGIARGIWQTAMERILAEPSTGGNIE